MVKANPIIQIAAAIFSATEAGILSYIHHSHDVWNLFLYNNYDDKTSSHYHEATAAYESFLFFTSIWSLLVLIYVGLAPLFFTRLFHRMGAVVVEAITTIFWLSGAIAFTVQWSPSSWESCVFEEESKESGQEVEGYCHSWSGRAAATFAYFSFLSFVAVTAIELLQARRNTTTTSRPSVAI